MSGVRFAVSSIQAGVVIPRVAGQFGEQLGDLAGELETAGRQERRDQADAVEHRVVPRDGVEAVLEALHPERRRARVDHDVRRLLPTCSAFVLVDLGGGMARKKSLWSKYQQELERRERVAQTQQRMNDQTVRQLLRDHEQALRQAAREDAAVRKRQEQWAHEAGASAAKAMKGRLDVRVAELQTLLTSALDRPPHVSFAMLKQTATLRPSTLAT
jgi:hypothetical protein